MNRQPLSAEGGVLAFLKPKETVAIGELPPEVLGMLGPAVALAQGLKEYRAEYEFRQAHGREDGTHAVACRFRHGFVVVGFAVRNLSRLSVSARNVFIAPGALMSILRDDRYAWYNQFRNVAENPFAAWQA
jgi:hypothetical protein